MSAVGGGLAFKQKLVTRQDTYIMPAVTFIERKTPRYSARGSMIIAVAGGQAADDG